MYDVRYELEDIAMRPDQETLLLEKIHAAAYKVLHCTVLYCTVLYCTMLYCTVYTGGCTASLSSQLITGTNLVIELEDPGLKNLEPVSSSQSQT